MNQQIPKTKDDWKKAVDSSGGGAMFMPDDLLPVAESVEKQRNAFNDLIKKVAEKEISLNVATQNMFFEFRKKMAENGMDDIWTKEVGFNKDALKQGIFIVNIFEDKR